MTWNYRIVKTNHDNITSFAIHEVYYENDQVKSQTLNPCKMEFNSLEDLDFALKKMSESLKKPILTIEM